MLDMNLENNNELKKYLDSYKRLFFRKQLDSPKSKLILEKKRESLGLTKEEADKVETLMSKNLCDSVDFISAIMSFNESKEISEDDLLEINEYCEDLGLEEEDIKLCLKFAKEENNNSTKEVETLDEELKREEVQAVCEPVVKEIKQEGETKQESKSSDIPNFKNRAKEILKIDNSEIEKDLSTESIEKLMNDSKEEKSHVLELLELEEKLEAKGNILDSQDKPQEEVYGDINPNETYDQTGLETIEILNLEVLEDEKIARENDLKDSQNNENQKLDNNDMDKRLFNDFDEEIEVVENEKSGTTTYKESTSFIRYDGEEMLSEENSLDDILDLESRDFRLETLKTLFYNGCLICVERFKDNIFDIRGRRNFTNDNIKTAFYDGYSELIDYTHAFLTKEGINDNSIEKDKLFESIFGLQCLQTLSKQISKINIMMDNAVSETQILNSVERSIGIYRANSDKPHFKTYAVRSITREIKGIFEEAKLDYNLRDSIEQGIYKLILEAVEFINKCGLANFDIYTVDHGRTLNELLEAKAKARQILGKYEEQRNISDQEYAGILRDAIVEYPFFEDTYVALSKVEDINSRKYNLLTSAIELLNKCGEQADNVINEIKVVEKGLYVDEISKISINADEDIKKEICAENIGIYNIRDFDIIFEAEINHFGYVVSDIDISKVSEDARIATFKQELAVIKEQDYIEEIRRDKIEESKEKYSIRHWECFKAEYAVFGKSFEGNVFADLDTQDRTTIVDYCMKAIKDVAPTGKDKRDMLCELQDRNIMDKRQFRNIEKDVFEFVIPLNEEETIEFDFMEKVNYIYRDSDEEMKALDISIKSKKWEIEIPGFYSLIREMQMDYEPVIMSYVEDDKSGKNKEGFVITDRAIYSSYAKRFLKLSEIESLKVRNYSKIKKGERIFYDGIFVEVEHRDYKLCSNYMGSKDDFSVMLNNILDAYRDVNGLAPLERPEDNTEEEMLLGIDSENILFGNKRLQDELKVNLEENKYYELMSDLLNYDNLTFREILVELSKLISKEIGEKIYFSEITEGSGEKIREACTSYVLSISELEEIYLVIDNSKKFLLNLQKLGMVISSKGIYCKNRNEDEWFIDLKYVNNIKTKDENKVQITNRVIEFPHIKKKQDLFDIRDLIEFIVVLRRIMDNPLEEIEEELGEMTVSPADSFSLELVNSVKSEELRKMLFLHSEGVSSEKKYASAMASYADINDAEKPVLLLDTTVFGLKTSGLLVTDKNIYYKEGLSNSLNINLLAISRIYIKNEKFYINGIEFKFASLNLREKTELCEKLSKLVDFLKNTGFKRI
ncbi:MAG: hypothetical protein ACRCWG_13770 [Sarcina sp.]